MKNRIRLFIHRPSALLLTAFSVGVVVLLCLGCNRASEDEFTRLTNTGKNYYDRGETAKALSAFQSAVKLNPAHQDAHLNLANAYLLANQPTQALAHAHEALKLDQNMAAAYYVAGCAHLRLNQFESALKELQRAKDADPSVASVNFQLGLAHQGLNQTDDAITAFQETIALDPDHTSAHYRLGQLLIRAGRRDEGAQELEKHREATSKKPNQPNDIAAYERGKHTQIRLPFKLEQPDLNGVKVMFADATAGAFENANAFHGPAGIIDLQHDGRNSLFVCEGDQGFRLLVNSNGMFRPQGALWPGLPGAKYRAMLVAELHQDRFEDVIVLGEQGSHVFRFVTNAGITDVTRFAGLTNLNVRDGALVDLDFTGKLDLLTLSADGQSARSLRNLGNFYFRDNTSTSGLPANFTGATQMVLDDWNNDDLNDVFIARASQPPLLLLKQRGGPLALTDTPADWPAGATLATGDLNNDLRTDLIVAAADRIEVVLNGLNDRVRLPFGGFVPIGLKLIDHDNDGWLDLWAFGNGLRVWRNLGQSGFRDVTRELNLEPLAGAAIQSVETADFDGDCDTDLLVCTEAQCLKLLRNDGGNANHQIKLRLMGNRSNPSGLGMRLEITSGGLRTSRTVNRLPVEIGLGKYQQIDSLTVRWFDLAVNSVDLKVECPKLFAMEELILPTGSCPYLYAWDGKRFRFVTDLLGAAPLGLRVSEHRFVEADPNEFVWIGNETNFVPRAGHYVLQITEELREVLYLDEAKLVVVDHPPGTEVHTTGKLRPGKPFPPHQLVTLHRRQPLLNALNHEGADVTRLLMESDGQHVSPTKLRALQLRGLAEPHSIMLDFGPLDETRPLVLALTGWLRFGGGMANVGASHNPDLPFPFPILEVEARDSNGQPQWKPADIVAGAPVGKTKTILVDLQDKLPAGARRLRLSTAFEIHWDRVALFEKRDGSETQIATLAPLHADLHWRGYSEFEDWPWQLPLTPNYDRVGQTANWRITPEGWCTRYGEVGELIAVKDNALALLNGGDELTLSFSVTQLPAKSSGAVRDFFLFSSGWDKDADFHCELGYQVEPLPWHGLEDQSYGKQSRPAFPNDDWIKKYNTRWVGPNALSRSKR